MPQLAGRLGYTLSARGVTSLANAYAYVDARSLLSRPSRGALEGGKVCMRCTECFPSKRPPPPTPRLVPVPLQYNSSRKRHPALLVTSLRPGIKIKSGTFAKKSIIHTSRGGKEGPTATSKQCTSARQGSLTGAMQEKSTIKTIVPSSHPVRLPSAGVSVCHNVRA